MNTIAGSIHPLVEAMEGGIDKVEAIWEKIVAEREERAKEREEYIRVQTGLTRDIAILRDKDVAARKEITKLRLEMETARLKGPAPSRDGKPESTMARVDLLELAVKTGTNTQEAREAVVGDAQDRERFGQVGSLELVAEAAETEEWNVLSQVVLSQKGAGEEEAEERGSQQGDHDCGESEEVEYIGDVKVPEECVAGEDHPGREAVMNKVKYDTSLLRDGNGLGTGRGLFASKVIGMGEVVVTFNVAVAEKISLAEARSRIRQWVGNYLVAVGEDQVLDFASAVGDIPDCLGSLAQSAGAGTSIRTGKKVVANAKLKIWGGQVYLRAIRNIATGDEIYYAYGSGYRLPKPFTPAATGVEAVDKMAKRIRAVVGRVSGSSISVTLHANLSEGVMASFLALEKPSKEEVAEVLGRTRIRISRELTALQDKANDGLYRSTPVDGRCQLHTVLEGSPTYRQKKTTRAKAGWDSRLDEVEQRITQAADRDHTRWPIDQAHVQALREEFAVYRETRISAGQYPNTQLLFAMDPGVPWALWQYEAPVRRKGASVSKAADVLLQVSPGEGYAAFELREIVGFLESIQTDETICQARFNCNHVYNIPDLELPTVEGLRKAVGALITGIYDVYYDETTI
jgi:hypothetical protein